MSGAFNQPIHAESSEVRHVKLPDLKRELYETIYIEVDDLIALGRPFTTEDALSESVMHAAERIPSVFRRPEDVRDYAILAANHVIRQPDLGLRMWKRYDPLSLVAEHAGRFVIYYPLTDAPGNQLPFMREGWAYVPAMVYNHAAKLAVAELLGIDSDTIAECKARGSSWNALPDIEVDVTDEDITSEVCPPSHEGRFRSICVKQAGIIRDLLNAHIELMDEMEALMKEVES